MADNVAGLFIASLYKLVTALWCLSVMVAMTSSSDRHFEAHSYLQGTTYTSSVFDVYVVHSRLYVL